MNQPPSELQKLLQHIDQQLEQTTDETTRQELQRLRARLNTPEMLDLARDLAQGSNPGRPARPEDLVLEFHDPLLPTIITATGCVVATATCLFAIVDGFKSNTAWVAGQELNLWVLAIFAGACSALFTALSFLRTFSVRVDTM